MRTKTFVAISNETVYKELCDLKATNAQQHLDIMNSINGYKSQVGRLKMALGGISALTMATLSWFIYHINH